MKEDNIRRGRKKTARGRKRRRKSGREQQVFWQRIGLAAGAVFLVLLLVFFAGQGLNKHKNAEQVFDEKAAEATQEETEASGEMKTAEETEEISIAAEIGEMDDEEDPQAFENEQPGTDLGVDTEEVLSSGNDYEVSGISYGIDVAKWQGTIDWQQVKDSGVEFAMIRVGYRTAKTGMIYEDPCAKYNLQQAQAAGIKLGAYFFSTAVTEKEAKEEAAWVAGFVAQYPMTYPVAYNCEGFKSSESRQYGMDKSKRTDCAKAFLDYISAKGYEPMFYAAKNEMEGSTDWDMSKLNGKYKIWVSQYPDIPYPDTKKSSYSGTHHMWQYTSQGMIPGISTGTDVNVAYFGYSQEAEAKDSTPPEAAEANPEALINFTEVDEQVTAKIETNLRSVPSTASDDTVVARLKNGDVVKRTGIGHNGWSRVIYNGEKLYAVSSYLTTDLSVEKQDAENSSGGTDEAEAGSKQEADQEIESQAENSFQKPAGDSLYKDVYESVTAKSETNLRSEAGSTSPDTIVGTLKYGEAIVRTGIGGNGWSRLDYNGQTVYAVSSYLTTDANYKENTTPTVENPEAGVAFTPVNEQVTAKIETNLRNIPTTSEPSSVIASLKNGEKAVRTGIGSNGWSRLDYNGQTVYAVSSYLTIVQ